MVAAGPEPRPSARWRIQRALRLGWRWRAELARAIVLLPVVSNRLRRQGYAATVHWLDARPGTRVRAGSPADPVATARELAYIVRSAARVTPDATCLRRALVLRHLLGRVGVASAVRLGVRPAAEASGVAFHAWVVVAETIVSEPARSIASYVVLDTGQPPPGVAP